MTLIGIGGGFAAVCLQVGAQASVKHSDVAMVTAVVLLVTEIGGSIGGAIGAFDSHSVLLVERPLLIIRSSI